MSARQRKSTDSDAKKPVIAGQSKEGASSPPGQLSREEQFERQGVLSALEAGLQEAMPGVEVLDRNLEFDGQVRADLALVDSIGRLLLVIVAREDPQQALLETLDVLAYLRQNAMLLVRHLASRQLDQHLQPHVLIIDSSNDVLLAERLGPLGVAGVRGYGVRTLRSSGSERSYLVAFGEELSQPVDPEAGVQDFLAALPAQHRELATQLTQRMGALDEDLNASSDENSLLWRWNGVLIARLECSGEWLRASALGDQKSIILSTPEHVDLLLEHALVSLMDEFERSSEEARDLPPGLGSIPGAATEPLLSDDEIRAFHD